MEILKKLAQFAGTYRTAIVYGKQTLSYRELNDWSDVFAAYLQQAADGASAVSSGQEPASNTSTATNRE